MFLNISNTYECVARKTLPPKNTVGCSLCHLPLPFAFSLWVSLVIGIWEIFKWCLSNRKCSKILRNYVAACAQSAWVVLQLFTGELCLIHVYPCVFLSVLAGKG